MRNEHKLRSALLSMLTVLAVCLTSLSLTSCSDDDDNKGGSVPANSVLINGKKYNITTAGYYPFDFSVGNYDFSLTASNFVINIMISGEVHDGELVDLTKLDSDQSKGHWQWYVQIWDKDANDTVYYGWGGDDDFLPYLSGSTLYVKSFGGGSFEVSFVLIFKDEKGDTQKFEGNYKGVFTELDDK